MEMEKEKKHEFGYLMIQKILVWLPVVSLLRFKTVCKSWRDLIQSPSFIHLHTPITLNSSSSSSSEFGSFIVHVHYSPSDDDLDTLLMLSSPSDYLESVSRGFVGNDALLMLSYPYKPMSGDDDGGGSGDDDQEEVVVVDDLGFDMRKKVIVGSCNGLVCIRDRQLFRHRFESYKPINVYLWNPATGQGMDVPESKTIPGDTFSLVVFGFDVETKDYKVVRFTSLNQRWNGNGPDFCFCRVQLYSLSTHSWRLLEHIPCLPGYPFLIPTNSVVYLNGTCFFMAHYFYTKHYPRFPENDRFIISFDFTKDIITPIQLPEHHRDQQLCLCSLGGDKIALFTSTTPDEDDDDDDQFFPSTNPPDDAQICICQDFNMWVLNYERGSSVTKESWKKLHSFQLQLESSFKQKWYTPSGISNDGKFALLTSEYGSKMNLYNFATKEVKHDFLSCMKVMSNAHAYKLSLVSVIGGNEINE